MHYISLLSIFIMSLTFILNGLNIIKERRSTAEEMQEVEGVAKEEGIRTTPQGNACSVLLVDLMSIAAILLGVFGGGYAVMAW